LSLEQERAKLAKVQAEKTKFETVIKKIEASTAEKKVVPVEEVKKIWAQVGYRFRAKLLSLSSTLTIMLGLTKEGEEILKRALKETLEELCENRLKEEDGTDRRPY